MAKFKMGDTLKEKITGFEGVVTGIHQWITGCDQYSLTPEGLKTDGDPKKSQTFDEGRLSKVPKAKRVPPSSTQGTKKGCDQIAPTK